MPLEVQGETLPLRTHAEGFWAPMQRVYRCLQFFQQDVMFYPQEETAFRLWEGNYLTVFINRLLQTSRFQTNASQSSHQSTGSGWSGLCAASSTRWEALAPKYTLISWSKFEIFELLLSVLSLFHSLGGAPTGFNASAFLSSAVQSVLPQVREFGSEKTNSNLIHSLLSTLISDPLSQHYATWTDSTERSSAIQMHGAGERLRKLQIFGEKKVTVTNSEKFFWNSLRTPLILKFILMSTNWWG